MSTAYVESKHEVASYIRMYIVDLAISNIDKYNMCA